MNFCFLLKIWAKCFYKNLSNNVSGIYIQKLLDHAKQSATNTFKIAWKRAKTTDDFISNKFSDKTT